MLLGKIARKGPWDTKETEIDVRIAIDPGFMTTHFGHIEPDLLSLPNVPRPTEFGFRTQASQHYSKASGTQVAKEGLLADHYFDGYGRGRGEEPAFYEGPFEAYIRITEEIQATPLNARTRWMMEFDQSFYPDIKTNHGAPKPAARRRPSATR